MLNSTNRIISLFFLFFLCGVISAQSEIEQERYLDAQMKKYRNSSSYRHVSVLGCNLGNTYGVFCENLKKMGYQLIKGEYGYVWLGKLSNKTVKVHINRCGKYIQTIHLEILNKNKNDGLDMHKNTLSSLTNNYGKCSRKSGNYAYWFKNNVEITLSFDTWENTVWVEYEDLIYKKWIKEFNDKYKKQKNEKERNVLEKML